MPASQQKLINFDIARVDAEEVRQAAEFQAAILADVAGRRGTLHGRIKPLAPHYGGCRASDYRRGPPGG